MSLLAQLLDHMPPPASKVQRPLPQQPAAPRALATVSRPAPKAAPTKPHTTAATATPEWRTARNLYLNHLMACRSCYAPTGRHCPHGAELRATYDQTPMDDRT